jgi:hypothetical protein
MHAKGKDVYAHCFCFETGKGWPFEMTLCTYIKKKKKYDFMQSHVMT